jgi:hypothetical protein
MVNGFSRRATSDECECIEEACLAKIGSGFEINNIQRGRVTCYIYEVQPLRSFGEAPEFSIDLSSARVVAIVVLSHSAPLDLE